MTAISPIFVVGVGRSGTSLLQSMLAAHPALAFPPETSFVRRYVATRRLERTRARAGWDGVEAVLRDDARVSRLGLDTAMMVEPFRKGERSFSGAALYERILSLIGHRAGKRRTGDKDPRLVEFLPVVHRYWPAAYIVHIVRDPRDVLASKKRAAWSRSRGSLAHVFANRVQVCIGEHDGRRLFGERYRTVKYEELVAKPEVVLTELGEWLGVEYDDRMLDFSDTARQLVTQSELPWKRETLGPLLPANQGKWRTDLSSLEVRLTEIACAQQFRGDEHSAATVRHPLLELGARSLAAGIAIAEPAYRLTRRARLWAGM